MYISGAQPQGHGPDPGRTKRKDHLDYFRFVYDLSLNNVLSEKNSDSLRYTRPLAQLLMPIKVLALVT